MNLKEFVDPPKQYRPAPFWAWNDTIEPGEVENRVRDLKQKGFGGFFMHSRSGLRTPYLSDDWMRAVRRGVEIAREIGMESWFYDEDRWPSGYCGGKTTENNPLNLAMALSWTPDVSALNDEDRENILTWTRPGDGDSHVSITEKPDDLTGIGAFYHRRYPRGHFWYNGENYVDLLNPDTVQDFITNTYDRYSKLFRYDFGEHLPGIFTDEPNVNRWIKWFSEDSHAPFSYPWTTDFTSFFENMHGYDPLPHLHHLLSGDDSGFSFRYDYFRAVNEMFIQSFTIQIADWCHDKEVKLTGHYLYEEDFFAQICSGGAVMPHYEYMGIPGVDHLGRTTKDPWVIRQVASVADQMGKSRVICEIFGCSGQSMSFADYKWIADYACSLGINYICQHLMLYSLTGDRKRDFPPTHSYHQPYWDHYRVMNDYFARISWACQQGKGTAKVLLLNPIQAGYGSIDFSQDKGGPSLRDIEQSYRDTVSKFIAGHIPFDIGDERILERHGSADNTSLTIGHATYDCVVLPFSPTWRSTTLELLRDFKGRVIILGDIPGRVDGRENEGFTQLAADGKVEVYENDPTRAIEAIDSAALRDVSITLSDGSEAPSIILNHRVDHAAHMLFLANTDRDEAYDVTITARALGGVVELDPLSGRAYRYASEVRDGETIIETTLYPVGSRIFLIDPTQTLVTGAILESSEESLTIQGPYSFKRLHENIRTIDRCSLDMDGKRLLTDVPVWKARHELWHKTGIDEFKGYQHWKLDEMNLRTRTNKSVLTFTFKVDDIPENIELALESADNFTVAINGTTVETTPGKWHIDRRIRSFDLTDHVLQGENTITASTDFLWETEIEDIYLVGDFAVGPEADGFPIISEPETLDSGSWVDSGYPFYAGSMIYTLEFELEDIESFRYDLDLSGARGSVFKVSVNDEEVGAMPFPPYRGDITGALKKGVNTVEIEVASTLRNTLGPLHHIKGDNLVWTGPEQFVDEELTEEQAKQTGSENSWTDAYQFLPYGFIEPPALIRITRNS